MVGWKRMRQFCEIAWEEGQIASYYNDTSHSRLRDQVYDSVVLFLPGLCILKWSTEPLLGVKKMHA